MPLSTLVIVKMIGTHGYQIVLPPTMRIHTVFHISLLEQAAEDPIEKTIIQQLLPIKVEGEEEYDFKEIHSSRVYPRDLQYLIK